MLETDSMAQVAEMFGPVMQAIAATMGPQCEVVLHSLESPDHLDRTIVAIENGHVTGRQVGGPTTNLGLEVLQTHDSTPDRFNYRSHTKDGRVLRSSSVYFRNAEGAIIGALCINLDITAYLQAHGALNDFLGRNDSEVKETFGAEIGEVLDALIQNALDRVGMPAPAMSRDDKIEVVRYLDEKGAFLVKRSMERVARALGISRVTAYAYLEEVRSGTNHSQ